MLGLLIYLPTLFLVPHYAYLFAIPYLIGTQFKKLKPLFRGDFSSITGDKALLFLLIFCFLGMLNNLLHFPEEYTLQTFLPYYTLAILAYLISICLTKNDIKVLCMLIGLEALVMIVEFAIGVNTIFTFHDSYEIFSNETLLYFKRPFGLSENSSGVAIKLILGLLMIDVCKLRSKLFNVVLFLIVIGILLSFNRTVMVSVLFYYGIKLAGMVFFTSHSLHRQFRIFMAVGLCGIATLIYLFLFQENIILQVTKGSGNIELSGRDAIWSYYLNFLGNNPIFGNGSFKLSPEGLGGRTYLHAHNSFLQILGNHGLVLGLLYIGFLVSQIRLWNLLVVGVIFLFSMAQYGIFWGISTFDIFLFVVLFNKEVRANAIKEPG